MKRSTVAAAALGVWLAGAVSAAALAHVLRAPTPLTTPIDSRASTVAEAIAGQEVLASEAPQILRIPVVTIVGRIAQRAAKPVDAAPVVRDITEMRCQGWRDLDMGSGRVQVCE